MIINKYLIMKIDPNENEFNPLDSSLPNFSILYHYLDDSFINLFDESEKLNLEPLYDPEQSYSIHTQGISCGLDIKNEIIYIFREIDQYYYFESDQYLLDQEESIANDYSDLDEAILGKFPSITIPLNNFIELMNNWYQIRKLQPPFALLYQDEKKWIHCKAFGNEEEMDTFIKEHSE